MSSKDYCDICGDEVRMGLHHIELKEPEKYIPPVECCQSCFLQVCDKISVMRLHADNPQMDNPANQKWPPPDPED